MRRAYQPRSHNGLAAKGRPFLQKIVVVFTNLITLWECRKCRQTMPHHPTKGHRMGQSSEINTCKSCKQMADLREQHRIVMAEHEKAIAKIRSDSAARCKAIREGRMK